MSCCNLRCCQWCVCTLVTIVIGFILSIFIFRLIFQPQEPNFQITNATLTQFNFNTSNNTLDYNLAFNMTIRNPNTKLGLSYRRIQVIGNYRKKRFSLVTLNTSPFYQARKNTTEINQVVVKGSQFVKFGKKEVDQYESETVCGIYSIKVQLALRIKAKYGKFMWENGNAYHQKLDCDLKLPLSSSNETSITTAAGGFKATWCYQNVTQVYVPGNG